MTKKIIQVDGGIGRVLCAEPAINDLARYEDVTVITSWPDVFLNHPVINSVWPIVQSYNFWSDVIKGNELITPEPYNELDYCNQNFHLTESFYRLIRNDDIFPSSMIPSLYLSDEEINGAKTELTSIIKDYGSSVFTIVIQPFGSNAITAERNMSLEIPREERVLSNEKFKASRQTNILKIQDHTNRSLDMDTVISMMGKLHRDFLILNFSHIQIQHPRVYNIEADLRRWMGFLSLSDYFIGVDSAGQHIAAALGVPGTVFFGATDPKNLGYSSLHDIIQRKGYPKGYVPYRQNSPHSINDRAMSFDGELIASVCEKINKKFFG